MGKRKIVWLLGAVAMLLVLGSWLGPALARPEGAGASTDSSSATTSCPAVANTPYFTIVYGTILLDANAAPAGTIVEAVSPQGDTVGCYEVGTAGYYGAMYVFGEDTSADPPIPGMSDGETIAFRVNGATATAVPSLVWANDRLSHQVDLEASSPPKAVVDLMAEPFSPHLMLTWSPVTENTAGQPITDVSYRIYRAEGDPYFVPSGSPHDITLNPYSFDLNALADPEVNYYYLVTVVDGEGRVSAPSNRAGSCHITLGLGWNLVSWPLAPHTTSLTDLLSPLGGACDGAWAYDAWDDADPWKHWTGDLVGADEAMGLWLYMTEPAILPIIGRQPVSTTIDLRAGWNLVGYPAQSARPVAEALASIDGSYTQVQTFDPTDPADPWKIYDVDLPVYANDLALMEPGRAYWIHVTTACTLGIAP